MALMKYLQAFPRNLKQLQKSLPAPPSISAPIRFLKKELKIFLFYVTKLSKRFKRPNGMGKEINKLKFYVITKVGFIGA
jgi:hypothetical protein